jgi:hypothetical protein
MNNAFGVRIYRTDPLAGRTSSRCREGVSTDAEMPLGQGCRSSGAYGWCVVIDPLLLVLRTERLDRGLSMREAGELIGNETYASIYNWESEKTSPTLRSLRRWADSLGFDVVLRRRGEAS